MSVMVAVMVVVAVIKRPPAAVAAVCCVAHTFHTGSVILTGTPPVAPASLVCYLHLASSKGEGRRGTTTSTSPCTAMKAGVEGAGEGGLS